MTRRFFGFGGGQMPQEQVPHKQGALGSDFVIGERFLSGALVPWPDRSRHLRVEAPASARGLPAAMEE